MAFGARGLESQRGRRARRAGRAGAHMSPHLARRCLLDERCAFDAVERRKRAPAAHGLLDRGRLGLDHRVWQRVHVYRQVRDRCNAQDQTGGHVAKGGDFGADVVNAVAQGGRRRRERFAGEVGEAEEGASSGRCRAADAVLPGCDGDDDLLGQSDRVKLNSRAARLTQGQTEPDAVERGQRTEGPVRAHRRPRVAAGTTQPRRRQ